MEVIIIKIGFIGAGKVGFSLGKYFKENKLTVTGYYSKNVDSANRAAIFTDSKLYNNIANIIYESDIIFITTIDSEIINVWNEVKNMSIKNKIFCHCSGSLSSKIFSNISEKEAYGYSIHPLLAISDKYNSYKRLKNAIFTIEGDCKYINFIENILISLGNKVKIISTDKKCLYHCSAVMVSNFVLGLINNGIEMLEQCGFSNSEAMEALYPLIEGNIKNIKENGLINSLTGPLERGDINTIKGHCHALNEKEIYLLLTKEILKIAKVKNKERDYGDIEEFIRREL